MEEQIQLKKQVIILNRSAAYKYHLYRLISESESVKGKYFLKGTPILIPRQVNFVEQLLVTTAEEKIMQEVTEFTVKEKCMRKIGIDDGNVILYEIFPDNPNELKNIENSRHLVPTVTKLGIEHSDIEALKEQKNVLQRENLNNMDVNKQIEKLFLTEQQLSHVREALQPVAKNQDKSGITTP